MQKNLSDKELTDLYLNQNLKQREIAERYGYTKGHIAKRLRALGITPKSKTDWMRKALPDEKLVDLHQNQNQTADKIAEIYGYGTAWINQRLRRLGVPAKGRERKLEDEKLVNLYEQQNLTIYEIAEIHGCSAGHVRRRLGLLGITLRPNPPQTKLPDEKLIELYAKNLTAGKIAKMYGYKTSGIRLRLRLRRLGIETRTDSTGKKLPDKRLIHLHVRRRLTTGQIGSLYGYSRETIRQRLRALGIGRSLKRTSLSRRRIEDLYIKQGLSQLNCALALGINMILFRELLVRLGITYRHAKDRPHPKRPHEYEFMPSDLKRLYVQEGWTMAAMAKFYGCSRPVISRKLNALGLSSPARRNRAARASGQPDADIYHSGSDGMAVSQSIAERIAEPAPLRHIRERAP
jgi:transcriptional regulator with XRE-family HTH domain